MDVSVCQSISTPGAKLLPFCICQQRKTKNFLLPFISVPTFSCFMQTNPSSFPTGNGWHGKICAVSYLAVTVWKSSRAFGGGQGTTPQLIDSPGWCAGSARPWLCGRTVLRGEDGHKSSALPPGFPLPLLGALPRAAGWCWLAFPMRPKPQKFFCRTQRAPLPLLRFLR